MRVAGADPAEIARVEGRAPEEALRGWRSWELATARRRSRGGGDRFALYLALKHALAGDRASALDHLERAYAQRDALLVLLRALPELTELRGDPRFERLALRIGNAAG
jgi:hypothetical protein